MIQALIIFSLLQPAAQAQGSPNDCAPLVRCEVKNSASESPASESETPTKPNDANKEITEGLVEEKFPNGNVQFRYRKVGDKIEGKREEFSEDGKAVRVQYLRQGVLEGEETEFFPDGNIKTKIIYINGSEISGNEFFPSGKVKRTWVKITDSGPQPITEEKVFWENGNTQIERNFLAEQIRHGNYVSYSESGEKLEEGKFERGYKNGRWRRYEKEHLIEEYYENKKLVRRVFFNPEGTLRMREQEFSPSGAIKRDRRAAQ